MRAVTFQAPGEVRVEEKAEPEVVAADDAVVRVEATGICGSDLHIFHGRVPVETGFTIGHEFVGTVVAAGKAVERVGAGDRVLGTFHTACATCASCVRGDYHRCRRGRVFGHGSKLGDLQGAQAEQLLVPNANLGLRRVPAGMSSDAAQQRLAMAAEFGATPLHLTEADPKRELRAATGELGADVVVDAVGDAAPLALAISLARDAGTVSGIGAYAGNAEVPIGLAWLKGLQLRLGLANVIAHLDRVLALLAAGKLDPAPLVTHRMPLDEAGEAYAIYDRREALKIVLTP